MFKFPQATMMAVSLSLVLPAMAYPANFATRQDGGCFVQAGVTVMGSPAAAADASAMSFLFNPALIDGAYIPGGNYQVTPTRSAGVSGYYMLGSTAGVWTGGAGTAACSRQVQTGVYTIEAATAQLSANWTAPAAGGEVTIGSSWTSSNSVPVTSITMTISAATGDATMAPTGMSTAMPPVVTMTPSTSAPSAAAPTTPAPTTATPTPPPSTAVPTTPPSTAAPTPPITPPPTLEPTSAPTGFQCNSGLWGNIGRAPGNPTCGPGISQSLDCAVVTNMSKSWQPDKTCRGFCRVQQTSNGTARLRCRAAYAWNGTGCGVTGGDTGCDATATTTTGFTVCQCEVDPDAPAQSGATPSGSGGGDDDEAMAGGKVAGIVIGVLLALFVIAAALFIKQKGMPTPPGWTGKINDNLPNIVLGLFSLSLLFAVIGMGSKTILIWTGDDNVSVNVGIFTTTVERSSGSVTYIHIDNEDTCGDDGIFADYDGSCLSSVKSRCRAAKAFSIIGFLTNAAILAAICLQRFGMISEGKIPKMAVPASALAISFCYMLVYAIWAELNNSDKSDDAGCGIETYKSDDVGFGGAFALWVIASLMTGCLGVLMLLLDCGVSTNTKQPTFDNNVAINSVYDEPEDKLDDNETEI